MAILQLDRLWFFGIIKLRGLGPRRFWDGLLLSFYLNSNFFCLRLSRKPKIEFYFEHTSLLSLFVFDKSLGTPATLIYLAHYFLQLPVESLWLQRHHPGPTNRKQTSPKPTHIIGTK